MPATPTTPTRGMGSCEQPVFTLTGGKTAINLQRKFDKARTLGRLEGTITCLDSLLLLTKYFEEKGGDPRTHQAYRHWVFVERARMQNKGDFIPPHPPGFCFGGSVLVAVLVLT